MKAWLLYIEMDYSVICYLHLFFSNKRTTNASNLAVCHTKQVTAAGDMCAICQEKMHAPVLLCCKHIFCEDCVSEWLVFP